MPDRWWRRAWRRWIRFAEIVGTIQMVIVLSVIYWTIFALIALPFKVLADPLQLRRRQRLRWIHREPTPLTVEWMRRQG